MGPNTTLRMPRCPILPSSLLAVVQTSWDPVHYRHSCPCRSALEMRAGYWAESRWIKARRRQRMDEGE